MNTSARCFITLLSASLLLTACQGKENQATPKSSTANQASSSALVQKTQASRSSATAEASQEEVAANSEVSDDIVEGQAEDLAEEQAIAPVGEAASTSVPEQLVGTWEVFYPEQNFKFILTYGADGSVVKTSLDLDTGETYTWNSTIGLFHDLGNGAVRFDEIGGDWHTVAQTGLGGGPGAIHTGVVFHEDGSISTKVWQFGQHIDPADYTYPTTGGVHMTRVE